MPDVTLTQAAADPKKGGAKKDAKKGKDAGVEEEKPVEDSIYVKEMKDAKFECVFEIGISLRKSCYHLCQFRGSISYESLCCL